ncbi:MAG TPA: dihydrodipicolinate synthase family protein [Trebonia sp.]|nr:dihydrodipicolinate synthase family protein [Trebonia sp.]
MSAPELADVLPVLATPFTADLDLDLDSLAKLTRWQVDVGARGVAVFGFASEGFALNGAERACILDVVREVLPPELALIAGVSATGTAEAVALAAEARRGGATHLMVLPPHMVTPSRAQLVGFYRDVAAVGVPVMIQDAPGNSRVTMPPDLIVELAGIEGVTSVKVESPPTAPKIAALTPLVPAGFDVLGGQNALFLLEELDGGSVGTMPACEFTDLLAEAVAAFRAGQPELARTRFNRLLPLIRFGLQPGLAWAVHKEVLVRRGLIRCAAVRPPAQPVSDRTRGWLDTVLGDLGLPCGDD